MAATPVTSANAVLQQQPQTQEKPRLTFPEYQAKASQLILSLNQINDAFQADFHNKLDTYTAHLSEFQWSVTSEAEKEQFECTQNLFYACIDSLANHPHKEVIRLTQDIDALAHEVNQGHADYQILEKHYNELAQFQDELKAPQFTEEALQHEQRQQELQNQCDDMKQQDESQVSELTQYLLSPGEGEWTDIKDLPQSEEFQFGDFAPQASSPDPVSGKAQTPEMQQATEKTLPTPQQVAVTEHTTTTTTVTATSTTTASASNGTKEQGLLAALSESSGEASAPAVVKEGSGHCADADEDESASSREKVVVRKPQRRKRKEKVAVLSSSGSGHAELSSSASGNAKLSSSASDNAKLSSSEGIEVISQRKSVRSGNESSATFSDS